MDHQKKWSDRSQTIGHDLVRGTMIQLACRTTSRATWSRPWAGQALGECEFGHERRVGMGAGVGAGECEGCCICGLATRCHPQSNVTKGQGNAVLFITLGVEDRAMRIAVYTRERNIFTIK